MSENGPQDPFMKNLGSQSDVHVEAWQLLLEEMDQMAEEREEDGWEVLTLVADHTNTLPRDSHEEKWGLSHIVPDSDAAAFKEFYDPQRFTEYLAYGKPVEGFMYLVTELIDPTNQRSAMIASRYDQARAKGMVNSAESEDVLYTRVQKIDGTVTGSFEHEEYEPLLGRPSS